MKKIIAKKTLTGKWELNTEILETALKEAEGKARERKLSANDVNEYMNKVDERLTKLGVCRKNRFGIKVYVNPNATTFANSYRGIPESTHFLMEYNKAGAPVIVDFYRYNCGNKIADIILTDSAKEDILISASKM